MKALSFVLALISLILTCVLGYFAYDMNSRLSVLANAQGAGQSNIAADVAKLQESVKQQGENYAKLAAQTEQNNAALETAKEVKMQAEQNKAAIDDMKTRINRLIDLIK